MSLWLIFLRVLTYAHAVAQPIDELLPLGGLPAGSRVLDLGCGSGTVPYAQFPQVQFFGLDQYAHTSSEIWPPNARLVLGDAELLPFGCNSFDGAICNFVFEHFQAPRPALRDLARVIRPGGFLYLSVPRSASLNDRLYRLTLKGGGHLQRYSFQSFLAMVYEETAFKLQALGPATGGFTWLRDVPHGPVIRSLLYRGFQWWRRATGRNLLASSDYLLLFRLGERPGFVTIRAVCCNCGNPLAEIPGGTTNSWRCPTCAFENLVV